MATFKYCPSCGTVESIQHEHFVGRITEQSASLLQFGDRGTYREPIYNIGLGEWTYSERDRIAKAAAKGLEPRR